MQRIGLCMAAWRAVVQPVETVARGRLPEGRVPDAGPVPAGCGVRNSADGDVFVTIKQLESQPKLVEQVQDAILTEITEGRLVAGARIRQLLITRMREPSAPARGRKRMASA